MNFQICSGNQGETGVTKQKDIISFSRQAAENSICYLLLYPKDSSQAHRIPMEPKGNCGTEYTIGIQGLDWKNYDYNFEVNGEEVTDIYAHKITGREIWADSSRRPREQAAEIFVPLREKRRTNQLQGLPALPEAQAGETEAAKIKSSFYFSDFKWKDTGYTGIKKEDMVIYKLHVRGFSMGMQGESSQHGTIEAVERKLNYLKNLGITTLLFMPVYEFEEILLLDQSKAQLRPKDLINCWGYTAGHYFAPKASYLGKGYNPDNLKRLIQKMHQKQMECILEFYFPPKTNPYLIIDVLRYWHREYHVDGFRLLGKPEIAELLAHDTRLSGCKLLFEGFREELAGDSQRFGPKLFSYNDGFLYGVRKMLNRQGGSIYEFACQMRRQQEHQGFVNYIAENNGFTLWDVFSYEHKHNEHNREENRDGIEWNFSGNCGQEGISRNRQVNEMRKRQVKNALAIVLLAQGVPMLWMGDECGNSQRGNNNAYCQDNETGWKEWKRSAAASRLVDYVGQLARIRREFPMLRSPRPFQLQDYQNKGCPDLSYHSDGAWKVDFGMNRAFIGMYYAGAYAGDGRNLYAAYNFQSVPQKFALPGGMEWDLLLDTSREPAIPKKPEKLKDIRELTVEGQSVCLLCGKAFFEEKAKRKVKKKAISPKKAGAEGENSNQASQKKMTGKGVSPKEAPVDVRSGNRALGKRNVAGKPETPETMVPENRALEKRNAAGKPETPETMVPENRALEKRDAAGRGPEKESPFPENSGEGVSGKETLNKEHSASGNLGIGISGEENPKQDKGEQE